MYIVLLYIYNSNSLNYHIEVNFLGHIILYLNFRESTKLLPIVTDLSGISGIPRISRIWLQSSPHPPIQARTSIDSVFVKTQRVWSLASLWIWLEFPREQWCSPCHHISVYLFFEYIFEKLRLKSCDHFKTGLLSFNYWKARTLYIQGARPLSDV